jgi:hypothetical protein
MRVNVNVSRYYDWVPVPPDVTVTEADVKAGRVRPAANKTGFLMRVTKTGDTHTTCSLSEGTIIALIIHEAMPQQGNQQISRKEAVGLLLARNIMPHHAHRSFMTSFEAHDDFCQPKAALFDAEGKQIPATTEQLKEVAVKEAEAAFRAQIAPYVTALSESTGMPLIDPDEVEGLVAKYMEATTPDDHIDHLHARFNVKKQPPASAEKAVSP